MVLPFIEQSREKIGEELDAALKGSNRNIKNSDEVFVFPNQPTELEPIESFRLSSEFLSFVDTIHASHRDYEPFYRDAAFNFKNVKSKDDVLNKLKENNKFGYIVGGQYAKALRLAGFEKEAEGISDLTIKIKGKPYEDYTKSQWKRKLDKVRGFLNGLAGADATRKRLRHLAEITLKGMDFSETLETLHDAEQTGLLFPKEIKSIEDMIGEGISKEDQSVSPINNSNNHVRTESRSIEPESSVAPTEENTDEVVHKSVDGVNVKKQPRVKSLEDSRYPIDFHTEKKPYHIPDGEIKITENPIGPETREILRDISGQTLKKSPLLEKSREELPDTFYESEAKKSFNDGDIGDALVYVERIGDEAVRADLIRNIVTASVNSKDISTARKFIGKIRDDEDRLRLGSWLDSQISIRRDTRTEEKEVSFVKPPSVSPFEKLPPIKPIVKEGEVIDSPITKDEPDAEKVEDLPIMDLARDLDYKVHPRIEQSKDFSVPKTETQKLTDVDKPLVVVDTDKIQSDLDNKIIDLREQIKIAERKYNEKLVLSLEDELRKVEYDSKVKEQIVRVKSVENTNENSYGEELAKLRILERQRDGVRAPKTETVIMPEVIEPVVLENKVEPKENLEDELDKAREEYAKSFIDWEIKTRAGKRTFAKTLLELGVTRVAPARLSEKTSAMKEAKEVYVNIMNKNGIDVELDSRKLLLSERLLLENRLQEMRMEKSKEGTVAEKRDANIFAKALKSWDNKTSKQKAVVSALVITGAAMAGAVVENGNEYYEGLRVDRNMSVPPRPAERLPEIESISPIKAPEGFEFAPVKEIPVKKAEEINVKKELTPLIPEVHIPVEESKTIEPEQIVDEPIIPASDNTLVAEDITKKAPETEVSAPSEHVPYGGGFVDVIKLDNGASAVVYNGIEIGHEHDYGSGKVFYLDDQYQTGRFFANIRGAFAAFLNERIAEEVKLLPTMDFEGGRIDILSVSTPNNGVEVWLNGRLVANGIVEGKKVKIKTVKSLKGPWWGGDTVFERAKNVAEKVIKKSVKK